MRFAVLIFFCVFLIACAPRVPPIPDSAREQIPWTTPQTPWMGKGRLEIVTPGKRISGSALIRGLGNGDMRAAFLSDEGLLLCDVSTHDGHYTVHKSIPDIERALPQLGKLIALSYGSLTNTETSWDGAILIHERAPIKRWYGGDPILLRAVTGDGLDIMIENYRPFAGAYLPHEIRAEGPFGITIRLHVQEARMIPADKTSPGKPNAKID
jgi:hypothetical protein